MRIAEITDQDVAPVVALWERCGLTRPWNDPEHDIDLARRSTTSTLLVGHEDDAVVASAMAGFDGHRGWVYYLAVDNERRGEGLGRTMMAAAEAWLADRGAPKLQLMVRAENAEALDFYARLGFERQAVVTLGKWIRPRP